MWNVILEEQTHTEKKLNHKMLDDRKRARIHYLIIRSPVVHINENALRYHRAQTSNWPQYWLMDYLGALKSVQ